MLAVRRLLVHGYSIRADGGTLDISPADNLPPELVKTIRQSKAEILTELQKEARVEWRRQKVIAMLNAAPGTQRAIYTDTDSDPHNVILTVAVLAASLALSPLAWADFIGEVVGVADGDTLTVLRDNEQVKVRLAEIDAPEKAQPFGNKSKQALSALVHGKAVLVVEQGHDRYKRTIGRVYQGEVDVSAERCAAFTLRGFQLAPDTSGITAQWAYPFFPGVRMFQAKPRKRDCTIRCGVVVDQGLGIGRLQM